jgi:hypothetical protein
MIECGAGFGSRSWRELGRELDRKLEMEIGR